MSNCYSCKKLRLFPEGGGGGMYQCADFPGLVLGEWGHWTDGDDPISICKGPDANDDNKEE